MNDSPSAPYVGQLVALFNESAANLRAALTRYVETGEVPDAEERKAGAFAYPELRIRYHGDPAKSPAGRAYGRLTTPGLYAQSVTRPDLFADYLTEQLDFLLGNYDVDIEVGRSSQEIPYAYVIGDGVAFAEVAASDLARHFPTTQLAHIGDEIADGEWWDVPGAAQPLALFDALGSISRWRGCVIIAGPSPRISSATCCSPTITATSTRSCAGRSSRCAIRTAAIRRWRARAG
jgi:AMP nucleosidase